MLMGFAELVEEKCGIHYRSEDRDLLASKLETQSLRGGYESLFTYYDRLRNDDAEGAELRELIEALVIHETYFFREMAPLLELVDGTLAGIVQSGRRARVLSAGCSTGEEPLTLAMLLDERELLDGVELVACDVSTKAIARARSGKFGRRALRDDHSRPLASRYLTTSYDGATIDPRLHAAVRFEVVNIIDPVALATLGTFDAILCRNVLIYFADDRVLRVVNLLANSLHTSGLLVVGVAESLLRFGTPMVCEEQHGSFLYRKQR
ncbi:MAG: protein-glutamate O-methyltransferase CheR [Myxococcales bacterium]|nr:protein-glutamate O-methyltransferase CheR [Myxococcales bacterium]